MIMIVMGVIMGAAGVARADWIMIAVSGSDEAMNERIWSRAETWLRHAGYDVLSQRSAEQVGPLVSEIRQCVGQDRECMRVALVATAVDQLLFIEVRGTAAARHLVARLYSGTTGELLRERERPCPRCSDTASLERVTLELTAAALDKVENDGGEQSRADKHGDEKGGKPAAAPVMEPDKSHVWLEITTEPPEAGVSIDGELVGRSGRAYRVTPGRHRVRVMHSGHDDAERVVDVAAGASASVHLHLARSVEVVPVPLHYGAWKWAALGMGIGVGVLGVTGMLNDGPRFDSGGNRRPEEWNTMGYGIAAALMGAGLVGVSGYMIWHDVSVVAPVPPMRAAIAAQRCAIARGCVTLGWSTPF